MIVFRHVRASKVPYHRMRVLTHLSLFKIAANLADDNFNWIFLNENDRILVQISLEFVPMSPIDNKAALIQVMAWWRRGDKPLSEPILAHWGVMTSLLRHNDVATSF